MIRIEIKVRNTYLYCEFYLENIVRVKIPVFLIFGRLDTHTLYVTQINMIENLLFF